MIASRVVRCRSIFGGALPTTLTRGYLSSAEKIPADSKVAELAKAKKQKEMAENAEIGLSILTFRHVSR